MPSDQPEPQLDPSALYQVLAENAPDAIITIDEESRVLAINPAAERLFGYPAAELVGGSLDRIIPERLRSQHHGGIARYLATGTRHVTWHGLRLPVLTRSGAEIPAEISFGEFTSGGRRLFAGFVRDVSERVAGERALASANAQLQEQATELEQQVEEAQTLTEELQQVNEQLLERSSESEAAHAAVAAREARNRALVEATSRMVWSVGPEGFTGDIDAWSELTGMTADELQGDRWLDAVHPDDRARVSVEWGRARESGGEYDTAYRLRVASGAYRWFADRGVPVHDRSGRIIEWVGVLSDIHERRQVQERLTLLGEAGRVLALSLDPEVTLASVARLAVPALADLCITYLADDERGLRRAALISADPAKTEAAAALAARTVDERRLEPVLAVLRNGRAILYEVVPESLIAAVASDAEHERLIRAMTPRSAIVAPLIAREQFHGALLLVSAESGRRYGESDLALAEELARRAALAVANARLYEASERARASAESANRAKDLFLATMSHEFRTPLNAIGGYAELLEMGIRGSVTSAQREDLTRIRRSQRHLLALVNDVLDLARLEAGAVDLRIEDVPVEAAIADAEALVRPQLDARGLTYETRHAAPGVTVRADHARLVQILTNLLSNSIKFTEPGGRVTLACAVHDDTVALSVTDTGIGIPADQLDRIFAPFTQVREGFTRTAEGTGLGLPISRNLARAMRGELTAVSTVGAGATFTVTVPRKESVR